MHRKRALGVILAGIVTLVGCATGGTAQRPSTTSPATTTSSIAPSTLPPVVECPGDGEFEEGGGIANIDGNGSDGSDLRRISWETTDRCESFTFDFETSEGAPATSVPAIQVDHLDSFQVIRIHMDIDAAIVTDQLVETTLVDRLYVVRALDGDMFVDLHLKEPAAVRARVQSSPARLTIDLRPGLVPFTGVSTTDDRVVVVAPTRDATIDRAPVLSGYSRTFEANVLVVVSQDSEVVGETTTTAADYLETWGEFETRLVLPTGEVSIFIGEASPEDGSLRGVILELNVE